LTLIALLLLTGPAIAYNITYQIIEFFGLAVGIIAVLEMSKHSRLNLFPEPKNKARLVNSGPYAYIRNPMYLSVLLIMGALILDKPSAFRIILYIILFITLLEKIFYEENILKKRFPGYLRYKKDTKRLIPYLY
jgi:protein-S-isoprenylcysteine O-methyltransferase Ste14